MKRYFIYICLSSIFGLSLLSFSYTTTHNSTYKEIINETEKPEKLFEDLFLTKSGGVFRGVNFDDSREVVEKLEKSRSIVTVLDDQKEGSISFTTDMGLETLNFADITYHIDEKGVYAIDVETFTINKEMADAILSLAIYHYSTQFGKGAVAFDGYTEFKDSKNKVLYAIKDISEGGDYGMKIHIDILIE
jgi:hypothetical protein